MTEFMFRAEWPITDTDRPLRDLIADGITRLNRQLRTERVFLLDQPTWTTRIQKGCPPKLIAEAAATKVRPGTRPPTKPPAACGTDAGFGRHRRELEEPCEACRAAKCAAERDRAQRRRDLIADGGTPAAGPRRQSINHGTDSGYSQHIKRGDRPCVDCRVAHSAAERARYLNRQKVAI